MRKEEIIILYNAMKKLEPITDIIGDEVTHGRILGIGVRYQGGFMHIKLDFVINNSLEQCKEHFLELLRKHRKELGTSIGEKIIIADIDRIIKELQQWSKTQKNG